MTMTRLAACAASLLLSLSAAAATQFVPLQRGGLQTEVSQQVVANVDVTGDGISDIVSCAGGAPFVLTRRGGQYVTAWHGPWVGCSKLAVGDRNANGFTDVIVSAYESGTTKLHVFEPLTSANAVATVTVPSASAGINALALADVDSDGHQEIVAVSPNMTWVYGASTLLLEWQVSGGGNELRIGNIDDDGRTEIVINGPTGRVYDAVAQSLEWGYAGGFGTYMTLGNVDGDAELEIVSAYSNTVRMLNGDDFSTSSFTADYYTSTITVADVNGDGAREIVVSRNSSGPVIGYSPAGAVVWSSNQVPPGVRGLAIGDVDGDGTLELCMTPTSGYDGGLYIASIGLIETRLTDLDGPFPTAIADLDGDGNLELIVASSGSNDGYRAGIVQVLDYETRAYKANLVPSTGNVGWWPVVWQIEVGQLDADPAMEVVILGGDPYDGILYVYDGVTYANQWTGEASSSSSLSYEGHMVVTNMDDDSVDEIVVVASDNSIQILNGASPIIQWTSPSAGYTLTDLAVADVNEDGKKDVIASSYYGLHVYTPATNAARNKEVSSGITTIAATAGRIVALNGYSYSYATLRSYKGSDLSEEWSCASSGSSNDLLTMTFGRVGGQERLLLAVGATLSIVTMGGTTCPLPATDTTDFGTDGITRIRFTEVTGDDNPELLLEQRNGYQVLAVGSSDTPRGDVSRDGIVSDVDLDVLMRYLLADGPGIVPAGDVTGNGCIDPADLFYLVNYRRGTGPAPIP